MWLWLTCVCVCVRVCVLWVMCTSVHRTLAALVREKLEKGLPHPKVSFKRELLNMCQAEFERYVAAHTLLAWATKGGGEEEGCHVQSLIGGVCVYHAV